MKERNKENIEILVTRVVPLSILSSVPSNNGPSSSSTASNNSNASLSSPPAITQLHPNWIAGGIPGSGTVMEDDISFLTDYKLKAALATTTDAEEHNCEIGNFDESKMNDTILNNWIPRLMSLHPISINKESHMEGVITEQRAVDTFREVKAEMYKALAVNPAHTRTGILEEELCELFTKHSCVTALRVLSSQGEKQMCIPPAQLKECQNYRLLYTHLQVRYLCAMLLKRFDPDNRSKGNPNVPATKANFWSVLSPFLNSAQLAKYFSEEYKHEGIYIFLILMIIVG